MKYIYYAPFNGDRLAPHLFNVTADYWEQHDLGATRPATCARMHALLQSELDPDAVDKEAKAFDRRMFSAWVDRQGSHWEQALAAKSIRWHQVRCCGAPACHEESLTQTRARAGMG